MDRNPHPQADHSPAPGLITRRQWAPDPAGGAIPGEDSGATQGASALHALDALLDDLAPLGQPHSKPMFGGHGVRHEETMLSHR